MSNFIIQTSKLHHVYPGNVHAIKGISLAIEAGTKVAIIGENGSGKTTLVKHFNGLLKPTEGVVKVKEYDTRMHEVAFLARYVGYVFQNPSDQIFSARVLSEVEFGPKNLGYPASKVDELVEYALKLTKLTKYKDIHPYELLYAQRRLLCIASIIAMDPEVIILDEPTGGLDYKNLQLLEHIIHELTVQGKTLIVISHDMDFVAEFADRVIVLYDGKVLIDGEPHDVLKNSDKLKITGVRPPQITRVALRTTRYGIDARTLTPAELYSQVKKNLNK